METPTPENQPEGKPPFFSSWNKMYLFVLAFMAGLILLFVLFSNTFSQ